MHEIYFGAYKTRSLVVPCGERIKDNASSILQMDGNNITGMVLMLIQYSALPHAVYYPGHNNSLAKVL